MKPHDLLRAQLAALDLQVPEEALPRLLWLLEDLLRWNRRINLTAITDLQEGIEKHLVDSLTPLAFLTGSERLLDLGSGGGFPGLPLKLARPALQVVSVEAVGRKVAFQRHAIRRLGLTGIEAVSERAEVLSRRPGFTASFEVVTARALASLADFASLALPYLSPGGFLLAMKGAEGEREVEAAGERLRELGLEVFAVHRLRLPASDAVRTLVLLRPGGTRQRIGSS